MTAFLPPLPCIPAAHRATSPSHARMSADPLSYASSGVDISLEAASIRSLLRAVGKRGSPRAAGTPGALLPYKGSFSGLIEFGPHLLAMCTDGVGSKLKLAAELEYYDTVGIDVMAMNVNDLLCVGAEPLAFVDYIAAPAPDEKTWAALGRGLGEACELANVSLCGGESASVPDLVKDVDVSGTALGYVEKGRELEGRVRVGDVVIGLPSSGVHSNGFSLVRKVMERCGVGLEDEAPFEVGREVRRFRGGGVRLGEVLMEPTRIYVESLGGLLKAVGGGGGPCEYEDLRAVVHVTGGGVTNLLRVGGGVGVEIDRPLRVWGEFEWIGEMGVGVWEMYRTFNMGMGMCLIVDEGVAEGVVEWLNGVLEGCQIVGRVDGSGKVRHCAGVVYDEY